MSLLVFQSYTEQVLDCEAGLAPARDGNLGAAPGFLLPRSVQSAVFPRGLAPFSPSSPAVVCLCSSFFSGGCRLGLLVDCSELLWGRGKREPPFKNNPSKRVQLTEVPFPLHIFLPHSPV